MLDFTTNWGDGVAWHKRNGMKREKESRHRIFDLDGTVHIQERGVASQMHEISVGNIFC